RGSRHRRAEWPQPEVKRGARDLYVRALRGLDRFVVAANPRAGVGRPTSRVFGVGGDRGSEQELREFCRQKREGGGRRACCEARSRGARKDQRGYGRCSPDQLNGGSRCRRVPRAHSKIVVSEPASTLASANLLSPDTEERYTSYYFEALTVIW
ncbi:hypothetical protein EJB05_05210, partial [Eragrostis curvula]